MAKEKQISGSVFDLAILKRIFVFVRPYKALFAVVLVLTIVMGIIFPVMPFLIKKTVDGPIAERNIQKLSFYLFLMIIYLVSRVTIQYYQSYLSGKLGQSVIKDIRSRLFKHVLRLKLRFFDQTPIGQLVTRTISDIETLAEIFTQGVAAIFGDVVQLVFILLFMFGVDWRLSLLSIVTLPVLLYATYIFKEKIKVAFNDVRTAVSRLNTFVQEHITGMSIVQIFNSEQREYDKFKAINLSHTKANIKTVKYYSVYFPIAELIGAVSIGLVVWFGMQSVLKDVRLEGWFNLFYEQGNISAGTIIAFIMLINSFFRPIRMIADRFNTLQMGIVSSKRILDLLDTKAFIKDFGEDMSAREIKGALTFDHVVFGYDEESIVLNDISFEVKEGEVLAFVGSTGAGKTSVINLITRLYEIKSGRILIDGKDIKTIPLEILRKNIGVVLQDVFLFSGSIRENITLGNDEITDEQIWETARMVGADKFISALEQGLDYEVRERGGTLSLGQRQLIVFVRTMVYDPKILILDEATSSVDTETEEMIQYAIEKMLSGRTTIVIAHRLSTIQKADKIIVLDKGEIKEKGTQQELLALDGLYSQLFELQYSN